MRKTGAFFFALMVLSPLQVSASFSDVIDTHENAEAIQYVQSKNIVSGYPDGTFKPGQEVNRAELAKILVEATFPNAAVGESCFPDVRREWFAPYVCFAQEKGLVSGYPDGTFKPAQPVSFVEAAKMISNAFKVGFSVEQQPWFKPYVTHLEELNAIPLTIDTFDKHITRGEMTEMIYRIHADVREKPSQTYVQLAVKQGNGSFEQDPQKEVCQSAPEGESCSKVLFLLPRPLKDYRTDGADTLQLLTDAEYQQSVFFIGNRFQDKHLFINGRYEGKFDRFGAAPASELGGGSLVIFGSGDNLFRSNRWNEITLSESVKNQITESIAHHIWRRQGINNIEDAIDKWKEDEWAFEKSLQVLLGKSDEQVQKSLDRSLERLYPAKAKLLVNKMQKQQLLSLTELFHLLFYRATGETPSFRNIFISSVFNVDPHRSLIFLSFNPMSSQVSSSSIALDISDGKLEGIYNPYVPYGNDQPIVYDPSSKTLAFRAINPSVSKSVGSYILSEKSVWVNGKLNGSYNLGLSFPRLSAQGELMYIGVSVREDGKNFQYLCSAIVGNKTYDLPCNDRLFSALVANTTSFRFPRVSPDGKTVVYPELVKASEAKEDWLYPEKIFTSRLVVNGNLQEAHPWIDIPYFTNKGLAIVTHSEQGDNFVEWNGKHIGPFSSLLPSMASSTDFRGYSTLFISVHGDPGDKDLPDEVIVSPDGMNIAFSGYRAGSGWTVFKNMEPVQTYDHVQHLTFSPDSKHLAYAGISIDRSKPEPGVQVGEYRLIQLPFERTASAEVIEDNRVISRHDKVMWMGYSPKDSSLLYVARDKEKYQVFRNGKPISDTFDALVMDPKFSSNGVLELGAVKGQRVFVWRYN